MLSSSAGQEDSQGHTKESVKQACTQAAHRHLAQEKELGF